MTNISELLERVREAKGADRELDAQIMAHFYERRRKFIGVRYTDGTKSLSRVWVDPETKRWVNTHPYSFTASIDAALALVERCLPGWWVELLLRQDSANAKVCCEGNVAYWADGHPTAPLAILSALLLALQSNTPEVEA